MSTHTQWQDPFWIGAETKPEATLLGRSEGQRPAKPRAGGAGKAYWLALGLSAAATLAIVPLYERESVTQARLDALEKFSDSVSWRAGAFRGRARPVERGSAAVHARARVAEPLPGEWAQGPY